MEVICTVSLLYCTCSKLHLYLARFECSGWVRVLSEPRLWAYLVQSGAKYRLGTAPILGGPVRSREAYIGPGFGLLSSVLRSCSQLQGLQ